MRRSILLPTILLIVAGAPLGAQVRLNQGVPCPQMNGAPGQEPLIIIDGVAQPCKNAQQGQQPDPFARFLFPPELVMQHQAEIGLTDAQRATLTTAMQQAQSKFIDTQFRLSAEGEKFARLLQGPTIDEAQALEQVDRVLSMEREMKRAQVGLLVRIKNTLTPAQQAKLTQLRP
jgi:Spy/CpxP family protein refolding chaperone